MTKLKCSTKQIFFALLINALSIQAKSRFLQDAFSQENLTISNLTSYGNNLFENETVLLQSPQAISLSNGQIGQNFNTTILKQFDSQNISRQQDFGSFTMNTSSNSLNLTEVQNGLNFQNWTQFYQNISQQYNISDQLNQSSNAQNSTQPTNLNQSMNGSWANISAGNSSITLQPIGTDNSSLQTNQTNSSILNSTVLTQNFNLLNQTLNQSSGNSSNQNTTLQIQALNISYQNVEQNSSQNNSLFQALNNSIDNSQGAQNQSLLNSSGDLNSSIYNNQSLQDNSTSAAVNNTSFNQSDDLVNKTLSSIIVSNFNYSQQQINQSQNQNDSQQMPPSWSMSNNSLAPAVNSNDSSTLNFSYYSNNSQNSSDHSNHNNSIIHDLLPNILGNNYTWNINGYNNSDFQNFSSNFSQQIIDSLWLNANNQSNNSNSIYFSNNSFNHSQSQAFDQILNQSINDLNSTFFNNSLNQSVQNSNYSYSDSSNNTSINQSSQWLNSTLNQSQNFSTENQTLNYSIYNSSINSYFIEIANGQNQSLITYCYSQDGYNCYKDYGPVCDLESGTHCSYNQTDGVTLLPGTYCPTMDNYSCSNYQVNLCQNITSTGACLLAKTTNQCFTQDGLTCLNLMQGFCLTFNGLDCTSQDFSIQQGSYCWSNDGSQCSGSGLPYLGQLDGSGLSQNGSYCVTQDNQTCLYDNGYFCNNLYNLTRCNIDYTKTITCLTYDSFNCALRQPFQQNKNLVSKQRQDIRNFFMYAIQGQTQNSSSIGTCDPQCNLWKDKCCVQINQITSNGTVLFDKLCMNKNVAQNSLQFQFQNNFYSINCLKSTMQNGSIKQISQIISIILASSILATIRFI